MKRLPLILLVLILASCSTIDPSDFSLLHKVTPEVVPIEEVAEELTPQEVYADQIVLLAPVMEEIAEAEGIVSEPLVEEEEEIPQPFREDILEAILKPSESVPEPIEPPFETPAEPDVVKTNAHQLPEPSSVVRLGANWELPMWFCYTSAGLFLASLFAICYISKQRKEAHWHKFRD